MRRLFSIVGWVTLASACSSVDPNERTKVPAPLPAAVFKPVEGAMGAGCASLDCHGQPGRNLRLYDARGLRLMSPDVSGLGVTSDAEIIADEESLLGLEPDTMALVLHEKGADPTRLSVVRKARGLEVHKGGVVWPEGSDGDVCLLSWLASNIDADACKRAATKLSTPTM